MDWKLQTDAEKTRLTEKFPEIKKLPTDPNFGFKNDGNQTLLSHPPYQKVLPHTINQSQSIKTMYFWIYFIP